MSWKDKIKKTDTEIEGIIEDIERARDIVRTLTKEYDIKPKHTEGLHDILLDLVRDIDDRLKQD